MKHNIICSAIAFTSLTTAFQIQHEHSNMLIRKSEYRGYRLQPRGQVHSYQPRKSRSSERKSYSASRGLTRSVSPPAREGGSAGSSGSPSSPQHRTSVELTTRRRGRPGSEHPADSPRSARSRSPSPAQKESSSGLGRSSPPPADQPRASPPRSGSRHSFGDMVDVGVGMGQQASIDSGIKPGKKNQKRSLAESDPVHWYY